MIGPLLIHLLPVSLALSFSLTHTHTHTHTRAHMTAARGNPALFMRCMAPSATGPSWEFKTAHIHNIWPVESLFPALSHTQSYTLAARHLFTLSAVLPRRSHSCFIVTSFFPQQCVGARWQMLAECGASLFHVAAVQRKERYHHASQRGRKEMLCRGHTKSQALLNVS